MESVKIPNETQHIYTDMVPYIHIYYCNSSREKIFNGGVVSLLHAKQEFSYQSLLSCDGKFKISPYIQT